jgi:nucleoside phosphorylase
MKIAVIVSMSFEVDLFKEIENFKGHEIKIFSTGIDRTHNVSRFGLVPAAQTCEKICNTFYPNLIVSVGTCGGTNKLNIGDVVIAKNCSYFDRILADEFQNYGFGKFPCFYKENFTELGFKICNIASSNSFIVDDLQEEYFNKTEAFAKDMESAAIADVAFHNNVNCVIIRGVVSSIEEKVATKAMENYRPVILKVKEKLISLLEEF